MTGAYVYNSTFSPLLAAAIFLTALGLYSWRRRSTPGALPFAIACLFWLLWLLGIVGELVATDVRTKSAWYTFQALWQLPAVTAVACFTLEYVYPGKYVTRRNVILLAIPPLLAAATLLTNPHHHLGWRELVMNGSLLQPRPGAFGWLFISYAMILAAIQIVALGWLFVRSHQHRWPAVLMASGLIVARVLYVLDIADGFWLQRSWLQWVDSALLTLLIPAITYTIALFGFRIFDPLPQARRTVVAQMRSGVVVFDAKWRVVDVNPAAEAILGIAMGSARGKTWQELLPSDTLLPALRRAAAEVPVGRSAETGIDLSGVKLGGVSTSRYYSPLLSPLQDFRGLLIGHVLVLRDLTDQKLAQEQIVEHQRALAVLQERERLARELHDGVAQTLAAAQLQANTAKVLLARGETAKVDECLDYLAEATLEAQTEIREYLLGAKILFACEDGFFPTLRHYAERLTRQYSLHIQLVIPPELEEQGLPQPVEVQLLRIIQEALSNVRKHARAPEGSTWYAHEPDARVIFATDGQCIRVSVVDNGPGFDPISSAERGEGYGLRAMRERAKALGGSLDVISSPGKGTQVVVTVPRGSSASGVASSADAPWAPRAA